MFKLCLFDLDQTLIFTDDLKDARESGKHRNDHAYTSLIRSRFREKEGRQIYSKAYLHALQIAFPNMKMGVFTRSPRSYAQTILDEAYPDFAWDIVVAYEDVRRTKPFGDGIVAAIETLRIQHPSEVVLVGDGDADIRSAYHAGCVVVLDRSSWSYKYTWDNWRALEHMADAVIDAPTALFGVLNDYRLSLPDLEKRLAGAAAPMASARFDRVNKFLPKEFGGGARPIPVYACGRSFSGYESLRWRRQWHRLTESIEENKDSFAFPNEWIDSVRAFISSYFLPAIKPCGIVVTCIPHRPGRRPRLESFVSQLERAYGSSIIGPASTIEFETSLLSFSSGVKSQHNDKLGRKERFENIRDHLTVNEGFRSLRGKKVLIIDDVSTTGASLMFAKAFLEVGLGVEATCLTIALNISDVHNG